VRGYKFKQIQQLFDLFDRAGMNCFDTAEVRYTDRLGTFVTPPVVEFTGGRFILVQGNTRALYCFRNGIEDLRCIVVRDHRAPLPSNQRIELSDVLIGGRTISTADRYGGDIGATAVDALAALLELHAEIAALAVFEPATVPLAQERLPSDQGSASIIEVGLAIRHNFALPFWDAVLLSCFGSGLGAFHILEKALFHNSPPRRLLWVSRNDWSAKHLARLLHDLEGSQILVVSSCARLSDGTYPLGVNPASPNFTLITPFTSEREEWMKAKCINIRDHDSPEYRLKFDYTDDGVSVSPVNFHQLVEAYQNHPEAKSLGPDGEPCGVDTRGLLQRAHIVAGEHIKIGKESDRHWEQGEEVSLLEFKAIQYRRRGKAIATEQQLLRIENVPKREFIRRGINQHTLEKVCRKEAVRVSRLAKVLKVLEQWESEQGNKA
jgi:hypothetical protein